MDKNVIAVMKDNSPLYRLKIFIIFFLLFTAGTNLHLLSQETLPDTVWTKELTHVGYIVKSLFSHDNSKVVVLTTSKIILFNTQTGVLIKEFDYRILTEEKPALDIDLNPISDDIALACNNGWIVFFNSMNLELINNYKFFRSIWDISYNSSGNNIFIVAGTNDYLNQKNIFVYDVISNNVIDTLGDDGATFKILFSKSNLFATYSFRRTGKDEHRIKLWDENTLTNICTLGTHEDDVNALDFSPDGKYLASGGMDTIVKIWDIQNRNLYKKFKINVELDGSKFAAYIGSLKFSSTSEKIVVGDKTADLSRTHIWNIEQEELIYKYNYSSSISIDISNDNKYILSTGPRYINLLNANWTGTSVPSEQSVETLIYPNPNDDNANIEIVLDKSQFINVEILDLSGNTIQTLFSGVLNHGINNLVWETKNIPSGTYFCKITGSSFNKSIKIIVNK